MITSFPSPPPPPPSQDCEDHAVLLCSLLLGFGQDAYVCVGTKAKGLPHAWVMTRGHSNTTVTFWESITGQRSANVYIYMYMYVCVHVFIQCVYVMYN